MNTKSLKLVILKRQWDAVREDYQNPERPAILTAFCEELAACGRRYFDDRLEAHAQVYGMAYGEDTLLAMIADGTLDGDHLAESIERHTGRVVSQDTKDRLLEQGHE